jgi:hypothetical protein
MIAYHAERDMGMFVPWKKSFGTVGDFYKAVEVLIVDLRASGNEKEASQLEQLFRCAWTTSSELIGELMLALASMKGNYPKALKKQMGDCRYFAQHHRRILRLG